MDIKLKVGKVREYSKEYNFNCVSTLTIIPHQEDLNVRTETLEYLSVLENELHGQLDKFGGNDIFTKIVGLLSPSRIQTIE